MASYSIRNIDTRAFKNSTSLLRSPIDQNESEENGPLLPRNFQTKNRENKEDKLCNRWAVTDIEVAAAEPPLHTRKLSPACARDRKMHASPLFLFLSEPVLVFLPNRPANFAALTPVSRIVRFVPSRPTVKETKKSNQKRPSQESDYSTPR